MSTYFKITDKVQTVRSAQHAITADEVTAGIAYLDVYFDAPFVDTKYTTAASICVVSGIPSLDAGLLNNFISGFAKFVDHVRVAIAVVTAGDVVEAHVIAVHDE